MRLSQLSQMGRETGRETVKYPFLDLEYRTKNGNVH
jgi:hypothetical protein